MARRSGGTHKGVEEKRRSLPIYQHYTLSPGKTKSHHPEAKCNHCLKEFVCGSKQRLIRHLRKCNNISNPEHIIAETLNTLARNSATGQLNHSILEASNLLPSQIPHLSHPNNNHHHHHQVVGQHIHHSAASATMTTANTSMNNNNVNNTSGSSCNETGMIATSSNGSHSPAIAGATPNKRTTRRGRKPGSHSLASASPTIHVTTGLDGKSHFTPASQLPSTIPGYVGSPIVAQVHNGRTVGFHSQAAVTTTAASIAHGEHMTANSGHLACVTSNHQAAYKHNPEPIDKAYLKLVLTRNLPLTLSDTKEFQSWVKAFAADYKPPSSINLIAQNLKNEAQVARQRVSNILAKAPKKTINLELHRWINNMRDHLWYAVIANVDHKRFLISLRDVDSQRLDDNQSHRISLDKSLAEFIDDCMKRIGSDRINSFVFSGTIEDDVSVSLTRQSLYTSHPSIVTYYCWWNVTNLLCSDVIELNSSFQQVLGESNRLMNFVSKIPRICLTLEKFNPFAGVASLPIQKREDRRWYSHLVCYLLEYIKNNDEAIVRALESYSSSAPQSHLSSDNNNNSSPNSGANSGSIRQNAATSTQQAVLYQDTHLDEMRSIIMSADYWANLNSVLTFLKPIQEIVALTSTASNNNQCVNTSILTDQLVQQPTPSISTCLANNLSLSDYMDWFLRFGKTIIDSWHISPDSYKYSLIGRYILRFTSAIADFKLLFAAYLLNPKYRCAYMTQGAKNVAIEEILNIASEFMPEESDGHTIFDQWKLYLMREEPYDMTFEENRSSPLDWWMSLPCAESIRRVALRILRLKAFSSPKSEILFSQLYFYEDEMKTSLNVTSFEDYAILRYFYDFEDKIGQNIALGSSHNSTSSNHASNSLALNGYHDRTQIGQLHNNHFNETNYSRDLPSGALGVRLETNGPITANSSLEVSQSYSDALSEMVVEPYLNHKSHTSIEEQPPLENTSGNSLESLQGYDLFTQYIDYNELGVHIIEEPTEKKKRKWTAQEIILSKCQSNSQNNNNNNDISSK